MTYRLLVVDDDPVARLVLCRILTRLGHLTYTAADVGDAVNQASAEQPDLVFADFQLCDGTGVDLLLAIRRISLWMPVVLVSGVADLVHKHVGGPGRPDPDQPATAATLTKPVDSRTVSSCLRNLLGTAW